MRCSEAAGSAPVLRGAAAIAFLIAMASCQPDDRLVTATSGTTLAPDFVLPALDGGLVSLDDSQGAVRVVNFWATWCAPCRVEMPTLQRLQDQFGRDQVVVLAVSVDDDPQAVAAYIEQQGYSFEVLLDRGGRTAGRYGASMYPFSLVIDKRGRLVDKVVGVTDWGSADKIALLRHLAQQ